MAPTAPAAHDRLGAAPGASPVRRPPDCGRPPGPIVAGPELRRPGFPGIVLPGTRSTRDAFFTVTRRALPPGNLIREGDELFGQAIEPAKIFPVLFDLLGSSHGNAFGALPTLEGALQDEVRTRLDGLALAASLEELAAEGTAPEVIDLFHPRNRR